jgi:hypothetical protein
MVRVGQRLALRRNGATTRQRAGRVCPSMALQSPMRQHAAIFDGRTLALWRAIKRLRPATSRHNSLSAPNAIPLTTYRPPAPGTLRPFCYSDTGMEDVSTIGANLLDGPLVG